MANRSPVTQQKNGDANLPAIAPPRLPYHPAVEERFGIDRSGWKVLVEAVFPTATTADSVILACAYCKARRMDVFKRVIHIVPIWNKERQCMVDTIWPGIGELRTSAARTGEYAGLDPIVLGPILTETVGKKTISYPEYAQATTYRMVKGQRCAFVGPPVYWLEAYSHQSRADESPNAMWEKRPKGQLLKCAEASALRAAFPEELGSDYCAEEINPYADAVPLSKIASQKSIDEIAETFNKPAKEKDLSAIAESAESPETQVEYDQSQLEDADSGEREPGMEG